MDGWNLMRKAVGGPCILYIHGANSSPLAFRAIKHSLPPHREIDISYDHSRSVTKVVDSLIEQVGTLGDNVNIVGHSLGGVVAVAVANKCENVKKIVTLSSPFGGSKMASLLRWLYPTHLYDDIHPFSQLMTTVSRHDVPKHTKVLSIVTTGGRTSIFPEENDGVVTVSSQTALKKPTYIRIPVNHFEVLLSPEVNDMIHGFLFT
jgi:pimeloyl-ACP methyl ester carboxylesterase